MATHTLGDWGIAMIDNGEANDQIVTFINGCTVNIAEVFGAGDFSEYRPEGEAEPHYEVTVIESRANGRLMAASPKLLAALHVVVANRDDITDAVMAIAVDAINKPPMSPRGGAGRGQGRKSLDGVPGSSAKLNVRVPDDLLKRVKEKCKLNGIALSDKVRELLCRWLDET